MKKGLAAKAVYFTPTSSISRNRLYRTIRGLGAGVFAVTFTKQRSKAVKEQRGYYWGYLVPEVGRFLSIDRDRADKVLCALFLAESVEVKGVPLVVVSTTSDLTPAQSEIYYTQIRRYAWANWKLELFEPGQSG